MNESNPIRDLLVAALLERENEPDDEARWNAEDIADEIIQSDAWRQLVQKVRDAG